MSHLAIHRDRTVRPQFLTPPDSTRLTALVDSLAAADHLQAMQVSRMAALVDAQDATLQEQGARIDVLQKSVAHQQHKVEVRDARIEDLLAKVAELHAMLRPSVAIKADIVRVVTVNGVDYECGFESDEPHDRIGSKKTPTLECIEIWAIGAVDISQYAPDWLARSCEREAEKQLEAEKNQGDF